MSVQGLPEAKLSQTGTVEPLEKEVELKRCAGVWGEDGNVLLTLTTHRLLIRSMDVGKDKKPRQLEISEIVKVKTPSGGLFSTKKPNSKLTLKTQGETKFELSFTQPAASIFSATEERDDFCRLIQTRLNSTPLTTPEREP